MLKTMSSNEVRCLEKKSILVPQKTLCFKALHVFTIAFSYRIASISSSLIAMRRSAS